MGFAWASSAALSFVLTASPAFSGTFCDDLHSFAGGKSATLSLPNKDAAVANCGQSLALYGARSFHCNWSFAYRSASARLAFVRLLDALDSCLGPEQTLTNSGRVNHPDSYDLRLFTMGQGTAYASLKDKGGAQRTLVFLRIETASMP
ncbi:MAG: hypothetical protein WBC93_18655 [Sulfitobacter sp.]